MSGRAEDGRRLRDVARGEAVLDVVARGHLNLQAAVLRLIEENLGAPQEADLAALPFDAMVELAVAMEVVPSELRPSLVAFEELRRRLLRDLGAEPTDEEIRGLYEGLFEHVRERLTLQGFEGRDRPARLASIVVELNGHLTRLSRYHKDRRNE